MIFEVWAFGFARGKEKKKNSGNAVGNQSENAGVAGMNPTKWKRRKKTAQLLQSRKRSWKSRNGMGKRLPRELLISRKKSVVGLRLVGRIYLAKARIGSDMAP